MNEVYAYPDGEYYDTPQSWKSDDYEIKDSMNEMICRELVEAQKLSGVRIDPERTVLVCNYYNAIGTYVISNLKVFEGDLQSPYDYFLCIHNPTKDEEYLLKTHRVIMDEGYLR